MASQQYRFMLITVLVVVTWTGSSLAETSTANTSGVQHLIDDENAKCQKGDDDVACFKAKAMTFLDTVMSQDNFKFADVEVEGNDRLQAREEEGRSHTERRDLFDVLENYLQKHDISMNVPLAEARVTVSSRNLPNNNEFDLKFRFNDSEGTDVVEGKGKKGSLFKKGKKRRLRKLAMPIMVVILLKAITVIPMAIGILKVKAINALGLGFLSFLVSVGLAIFQLCKKIASEHHHSAHFTAHGPWDGRSLTPSVTLTQDIQPQSGEWLQKQDIRARPAAQTLAYNAYVN